MLKTLSYYLCQLAITGLVFTIFCGCDGSNVKKGNICLQLGDYEMAIQFFEKELFTNPGSFHARLGYGQSLLQKVVDNNNDTLLWKKALTQLEAARTLQSIEDISRLLSDAWYERSRLYLGADDSIGALIALSRAIEIDNQNVLAINSAGILYFKKGDVDKAESLFKKALVIDSVYTQGHFNLGMVAWSRQEFEKARTCWMAAAKIDPDDEDIIYWLALSESKLKGSVK